MESRKKAWSVVAVVVASVCAVAVAVRENAPEGTLQEGAATVCTWCERAGVLLPDGGVLPPPMPPVLEAGAEPYAPIPGVELVREGTGYRPVRVPPRPAARATVEEMPEAPNSAQAH